MFGFFKKKEIGEKVITKSIIKDSDNFHNVVVPSVLTTIKEALENSYGPLGSNTMIHNNNDNPIVTKDGYTILKNLNFYDPVEKDIHRLILKISHNLVKTVGDGSTSAVLNAISLYSHIIEYLPIFINRKDFISFLNKIQTQIINRIERAYSYEIDPGNRKRVITAVASVANNNDISLGNKIADLFTQIPAIANIKLIEDPHDKEVDLRPLINYGFNFSGGLSTMGFLETKSVITLNNCLIFTSYEFFAVHYEKLLALNTENKYIVVIADIIDSNTQNMCLMDFHKGGKIVLVKTHNLQSESNHNEFIDLSIYLDSNTTDIEKYDATMFGSCRQVDLYPTKTVFMGGYGILNTTPIFEDRVANLEKEYNETPENLASKKGNLKLRLDKLHSVNVSLFVSGRTEEERKTAMYLVEDSINAIRSTITKGFTLGGNVVSFYACDDVNNLITHTERDQMHKASIDLLDDLLSHFNNIKFRDEPDEKQFLLEEIMESITFSYFEMATHGFKDCASNIEDFGEMCNIIGNNNLITVFNKVNNSFEDIKNTSILAPVQTDIEILKASFSIVCLLLSINQTIVA